MDRVSVWRGKYGDPVPLFGPLPGLRDGNVVAYEFELPNSFVPWSGRTRLERTFVLLDVGVGICNPVWREMVAANGAVIPGVGAEHSDPETWYVDLLHVTEQDDGFVFRDLYIDVIVPRDGRHYRTLDLDEFADAIESGSLPMTDAVSGLRRWQEFLDRYLHDGREATHGWTDFPPSATRALAAVPQPLGDVVRVEI